MLQEIRVFVVGRDRVRSDELFGTVDGALRRHDECGRDHQRGGDEEGDVEEESAHRCVLLVLPFSLFIWFGHMVRVTSGV